MALPGESFSLSLTPGLIAKVYGGKLADPEPVLRHEGGYADLDGDGAAWVPSGRMFYSPDALDDAAAELAVARRHFFLLGGFAIRSAMSRSSTMTGMT